MSGRVTTPRGPVVRERRRPRRVGRGWGAYEYVVATLVAMLGVLAVHPLLHVLAQSFSGESAVREGRVWWVPVDADLGAYRDVLADDAFRRALGSSVLYTALGVTVSVCLTVVLAYVASRRSLPGRRLLVALVVVTMFVNGGVVPTYVLVSGLGMTGTVWALVLPGAVSAFGFLVVKAWLEQMPQELEDAALVDGVGWVGLLVRIVLPASRMILVALVLLTAVAFWNDWFSAFLYLDDRSTFPVTLYVRDVLSLDQTASSASEALGRAARSETRRAAVLVLTMAPMVVLYPVLHLALRRTAGSVGRR